MTHLRIADYFDSVIVSSDFWSRKIFGETILRIKSALKAENEKILSIGDNILSDVHIPHTRTEWRQPGYTNKRIWSDVGVCNRKDAESNYRPSPLRKMPADIQA